MDAEQNLSDIFAVMYNYGRLWHTLSIGLLAELNGELAFSASEANTLDAGGGYQSGPSLPIWTSGLTTLSRTTSFLRRLPQGYITEKRSPLATQMRRSGIKRGHFWIGDG